MRPVVQEREQQWRRLRANDASPAQSGRSPHRTSGSLLEESHAVRCQH